MSLPICEIFGDEKINGKRRGTLQGEGLRMGVPSIFVRTGGCNLTCTGFGCTITSDKDNTTKILGCDSIMAVNAKHFKHTWTYYDNAEELIIEIKKHFYIRDIDSASPPDIVFTGGEPLLHYTDPALLGAIEYFNSRGHKIYFETNGTQFIDFEKYSIYKEVSFSMSVKMQSSGEPQEKRWKPEVVNQYLRNTSGSYFKFVLSKKSLNKEATEVFDFLRQVHTFGIVYCMPLGENQEELQNNAQAVYEFAAHNGFRYSDRLHIRVYDTLRGV